MKNSTFSAQVANNLLTLLQGYSKTIRLLLVMLLTLTVSANAWAADVTCDFTSKSGSHGAYTDSWQYGDFTVFGGANNNKGWAYVKMGGKNTNLATANPVYISSPKMTSAISKVQVSIIAGSLAKTGMSVNSWGVYVYSDAKMTNQVDYVEGGTITKNAAVFEFTPTSGTTWSANNYYKVSFNLTNTTTTNGIIWLDKITFVESTGGGGGSTPTQLAAPTGLTANNITSSGATLSWNAVANASSYTLQVYGENDDVIAEYTGLTQTIKEVSGLEPETYYVWGVTAIGNGTTYEDSNEETADFTTSAPAGGGGDDDADTWTLVKNVNDLAAGDQVVIAASGSDHALSTTQNNNNRGQAAVTKNGETITFGNDVQVLTLQTGNVNGTLAFYTGNGYLHAASSSSNYLRTETTLSNNSSWTITITNTGIATIKAQGTYTKNWLRYNSSSSIFSCYSSGQGDVSIYKKGGSGGGGSTPDPDPIPVTSVSLDKTSHTMNEGETVTLTATVLPANADDPSVSWKSDNEAVAKVNTNGVVTAVSPGTATITVTTTDGGHTATCTITVNALPTVEGTWTLVTNAANLKAGDHIVIAAAESDFALSTTQNTNNRGQAAVTKKGNNITFTGATQIITLEAGTVDNTLAFNTGDGYLYAASSGSNHLKTQDTNNDNGSWSISIDNTGVATVVAKGSNTRSTMQYNKTNGLFACYETASQQAIAIYKEGGGTSTYTITSTLSHVTADGGNPTTITSEAEDLTLSYSAESGWNLPATISVTMGGTPLSSETDYYWDNGDLLIDPANGFTGNIVVTINGWQQLAAPTGLNVANITSSGATLSWGPVANASSYMVFITDLDDEEITLTDIEKTSVDVTNLSSETFYLWDVVAIGDGINYTDSEHSSQEDPNAEFTTLEATTPTAGYTIIHSRQALDDSYPESLIVKTTGTANVGSTITAEQKTYTGFVCNGEVQTITIQEDAAQNVVTYKYVRQSYTLTWDLDGGTIVTAGTPAGTVKYGAPLTAPTVEKAGYRFDHWNPNVPATMQDGNRTYKAFYTQQHTVKWVSQGTVIRTDTYDTGAALEAAPTTGIVECDGKKHVGWTAQGGYAHSTAAPADLFTESSGTVTADATYYAVYAEGSGGGGTEWTAVTSTSNLEAGATYAISNEATGGTYLSTWDGGNNFDGSTTTICPLILGGSEGAWTFQISDESTHNDKYLTATSAASNRLKAVNPVDDYSYFTISFDNNGNAVITCTGKNTNNILRYNANNGSPIFACYSSGQSDVYLQKQTGGGGYTNYTTSCATITDITIEGYITEFKQHDEFVFGGKVYAIDEEDNETDVTELATFTGYDMSQAGEQTVTVTYLGHQETYTITVTELPVWNITWSVGGKTDTGIGPREVVQGKTIGECSSTGNLQIPEIPDACEGKYFMGWSASSTVNSDGSDFTPITSATVPETNVTYYAVFAEPTGNGGAQGELFSESFETIEGSGGNDGQWDGNIASAQLTEHGNWVFSYAYKGDECIKLGKASGQGEATTPALDINGNATLTFAAGAWNGNSENLTINLQIVGEGSIKPSSVTLTKGQFNTYTANITDANADTKVQFIAANAATNRFFLDEVKVSGGSSDSYTDYSTSCGTYTITFYGFEGGFTTDCTEDPDAVIVPQGDTYQIPDCTPTQDPQGLGRTFAGTWNTQANGKGTAYEPGDEFIVNSDITLYAQWALNTSGNTTLPTDVEDLATTDIVVTGGTTLTLQAGTTTINSLTLKGGLQADGSYAMPVVNIPTGATLVRNNNKINLDLKVNNNSYYPFAVPFEVANTSANVNYINPKLKEYANAINGYGTYYRILEYNGALRAENGVNSAENWVHVGRTVKLMPGKGYAISAVPASGQDTVTIRITMTVDNAWLANGELESITVKEQTTTRNAVEVTAYTGAAAEEHQRHAGWNFVANPYLANFAGNNVANDVTYIKGSINIQDKYTYEDTEVIYVTVPAYNFAYYEQFKLSATKLSPAYSFFVQVGKSGTMTFETAGRQQAPASIAARNAEERPVKMDVDITLSDNHSSDQTGIIISDRYSDAYEIGRDLEKLFGSAYNLSVYTLMADNTPLAFQALAIRSNMQVIPVGYRTPAQGEYTFRLNEATSSIDLLNEQYEQLVLVDYQTGELTNLLISDYTFYSERTQADNRFAIYAVPRQNAPTDLPNAIGQDKQAQKIIHNGHLYILRDGSVYNGNGQIVK